MRERERERERESVCMCVCTRRPMCVRKCTQTRIVGDCNKRVVRWRRMQQEMRMQMYLPARVLVVVLVLSLCLRTREFKGYLRDCF